MLIHTCIIPYTHQQKYPQYSNAFIYSHSFDQANIKIRDTHHMHNSTCQLNVVEQDIAA